MATSTPPSRNADPRHGRFGTSTGHLRRLHSPAAPSQRSAAGQRSATPRRVRHFLRHLAEMYVAMMVGMMVLGVIDGAILAAAGTSVGQVRDRAPEVVALAMTINMTVGMTVWMRHRRHAWAMCAEMGAAMFIPAAAAIVLFWCGVIHGGSVGSVEMNAMLPAMIAVMLLRRSEYSQPVHSHVREAVGQS